MARSTSSSRSGHAVRGGASNGGTTHRDNSLRTAVTEIYRGRTFLALLRDLALGEWSYAEIAAGLNVRTEDVAVFADEHGDEIAEVKRALAGELAIETSGLWITHMQNRLAELQGDFEDIDLEIQAMRKQGVVTIGEHGAALGSKHHRELVRTRMNLLQAVSELLDPKRPGVKPKDVSTGDESKVQYALEVPDSLKEALS